MARFLRQLALAAGSLFAFASTAFAGINTWTGVGPEGGDITHLVITTGTPPAAYALTPQALYRSNDVGRSWAQVGAMFRQARDLAVHPTQANRVFIIANSELLASTDGGATRVTLTSPTGNDSPIFDIEFSADGALLYASDGSKLYRSSDFGATWTAGFTTDAGAIFIDPTNANRVIAVGPNSMSITSDAGAHWTSMASPPVTTVTDIAFSPSGPRIWAATSDGLWHTSDDGGNWTLSSLTSPTRVVGAVAVDPIDPSIVYAQVHSAIYRSTDGGAQWTRGNGTYGLWDVNAFAFDPQVRERVLIATLNGVWASTDTGANWSRSNNSLVATTTSRFTSTPDRTYFVVRGEVHYLESGANAAALVDPIAMGQALPFDPNEFLYALHADRVPTGDRLFVGSGGLARSLDGGQTWSSLSDPLASRGIYVLDVSPGNPNLVLAATGAGVVRSIDGGDHWSTTSGLPPETLIETLAFTAADVAFAADYQRVYKSTDAGLNWSRVDLTTLPNEFVFDVFAHGNMTYIGTTLSGYQSSDGGVSWTRLPFSSGGRFAADSTGIYFGGSGVSRSVDGGNTWTTIATPTQLDVVGLHLDPNVPGRLMIGTWYGGVQTYTVATDLSVTAEGQPSVAPAGGVRAEIRFTVTNRGPHAVSSVNLDINVAGGRTLFENADCKVNASVRSAALCTFGPLASGESKTVRIESSFETAGPLSITAAVGGTATELAADNNTISASWSYNAPASPPRNNGGGGGALSSWMLIALAGMAAARRRSFEIGVDL